MEQIAISGSNGFLGSTLGRRLEQFKPLKRDGYIPEGVDVVFDAAAYGNSAGHRGSAKKIYKANLTRVITEMNWLEANTKYVYMSTSSVKLSVQTNYSLSKRAAEDFLQIQDRQIAIVRPFTITGVGDQSNHLIPTLIRSCFYNEEMPFVSKPHHDFIDVEDMVDALLTIKDKGQFTGEIYEIGTGKSYSNQEVKEIVEEATKCKANIKYVKSLRKYDSEKWVSNNTRICSLDWKPKKSLKQSIQEMVEYEKKDY